MSCQTPAVPIDITYGPSQFSVAEAGDVCYPATIVNQMHLYKIFHIQN